MLILLKEEPARKLGILITGGAGFTGSQLAGALTKIESRAL